MKLKSVSSFIAFIPQCKKYWLTDISAILGSKSDIVRKNQFSTETNQKFR